MEGAAAIANMSPINIVDRRLSGVAGREGFEAIPEANAVLGGLKLLIRLPINADDTRRSGVVCLFITSKALPINMADKTCSEAADRVADCVSASGMAVPGGGFGELAAELFVEGACNGTPVNEGELPELLV